MGPTH